MWPVQCIANSCGFDVQWNDEAPPTLGVREPRKPSPPSLSGGARAPLAFEAEYSADEVAPCSRVEAA